jgi:hypothetical protein
MDSSGTEVGLVPAGMHTLVAGRGVGCGDSSGRAWRCPQSTCPPPKKTGFPV